MSGWEAKISDSIPLDFLRGFDVTKLPHINHSLCALRQEIEKEAVTDQRRPAQTGDRCQ